MKTKYPDVELDHSFHPVENNQPLHFTPGQIEQFNREGYTSNVSVFEGEQLAAVQQYFREVNVDDITSKSALFQSFHHTVPELFDIATNPTIVTCLQDLIGPNIVCFASQYINKAPGSPGSAVVWHQDASFNAMDSRAVIVWLAIEDANIENGCMWFVPGSHHNGLLEFGQPGHKVSEAESYGTPVPIEVKAGQVVLFSDLLLHSSPPNVSKIRSRPGLTISYIGAEVVPYHQGERAAVLCSGDDVHGNWKHHARPESSVVAN